MMATRRKAAPKKAEIAEKPQEAKEFSNKKVSCTGFAALNVRRSPSLAAPVIGELADGAEVSAAAEKRGWCELESGGYVRACFLA